MGESDTDPEFAESVVKEAGNGAHVYVPSDWLGEIVRITPVAGLKPALFEGIEDGDEVYIDYVSEETDEQQTVSGTVESVESTVAGETVTANLTLAWETDEEAAEEHPCENAIIQYGYQVSVQRDPGEDGWEGPFQINKRTTIETPFEDVEDNDDADILEYVGGESKRLGAVESLSVKRTVEA